MFGASPTFKIQKPIDFTRQNKENDGTYEEIYAERLYLLKEDEKTGNALYILDGKTTDVRNPLKRTYLLSSIDGVVRNCPISEEEIKQLPKRNTLRCIAKDYLDFYFVLPERIPIFFDGMVEDFENDLAAGSTLLSVIDSIYDDKSLLRKQLSCSSFHFIDCAAIFNRFGQLINVFVKLKKNTQDGPIVYYCNLQHLFPDSIGAEVTNTIRRNVKCLFTNFKSTDFLEMSLKSGSQFVVQPIKTNDANLCKAFEHADFVLANYGNTAFLSAMVYNGGPVLCLQNKKIIYDNLVPLDTVYQDCTDEVLNPSPRTTRVKVLRFPR